MKNKKADAVFVVAIILASITFVILLVISHILAYNQGKLNMLKLGIGG